jgi:hypothetical protein
MIPDIISPNIPRAIRSTKFANQNAGIIKIAIQNIVQNILFTPL